MAFELLRTDYVDSTFEGLRRYLVSENGDGSVSFHDITNYTVKEKSFFGAKDANTINTAVNAILAALENGTDLYEVFTQFFELQKTLFLEESDAKQGDFTAYITQLREYMDRKWDELKTEYTGDIQYFKDVQENAFNVWFQMVRDQLTNDVAGHLQTQIGNLELLDTENKESLVNAVNELKGVDDSQNKKIGDLDNLQTTEKGSLVVAINNVFKTLGDRIANAVKKSGDTMTGTLHSSKKTQTYIAGNRGDAIINSTAPAGEYVMLDKLNSTNGYFTDGVYTTKRELHYTPKTTVDAGTNSVAKTAVLLDEEGNTNFPGKVTANSFAGNASKLTNIFTKAASRQLPSSGEALDITIGKVSKYLSDLREVAFSQDYKDLHRKPIRSWNHYEQYNSTGAAIDDDISYLITDEKFVDKDEFKSYFGTVILLVVGYGGAYGANTGASDYYAANLLFPKYPANPYVFDTNTKGYSMQKVTLGSSGSTARFNIIIQAGTETVTPKIFMRTPNNAWSKVYVMGISADWFLYTNNEPFIYN